MRVQPDKAVTSSETAFYLKADQNQTLAYLQSRPLLVFLSEGVTGHLGTLQGEADKGAI